MPQFSSKERILLAKKGLAMPDGGYPIRNISDLKNAISAYGRGTNKPEVKKWIKKRAKELNAEKLLPNNWRESDISHSYVITPYLTHHGVKGMKWGVRKDDQKGSDNQKTTAKLSSSKAIADNSSNIVNSAKSIRRRKKAKNAEKLDLSNMSDKELQNKINRYNLEKQYRTIYSNSNSISKGAKRVDEVLDVVGDGLAITSSALAIALAINRLRG